MHGVSLAKIKLMNRPIGTKFNFYEIVGCFQNIKALGFDFFDFSKKTQMKDTIIDHLRKYLSFIPSEGL